MVCISSDSVCVVDPCEDVIEDMDGLLSSSLSIVSGISMDVVVAVHGC